MAAGFVIALRTVAQGKAFDWPSSSNSSSGGEGCYAVVTGSSRGVGLEVAVALAQHGYALVLVGPSMERLKVAEAHIQKNAKKQQSAKKKGGDSVKILLVTADFSNLADVKRLAQKVQHLPIGLLVNNAGVLTWHLQRCAAVGGTTTAVERMLCVNALAPQLLTELLLPTLHQTAERRNVPSRIVNVASCAHTYVGERQRLAQWVTRASPHSALSLLESIAPSFRASDSAKPSTITKYTWYNFVEYYGLSKLCLLWYSAALSRRVLTMRNPGQPQTILVAAVHPGVLLTDLYREVLPAGRLGQWIRAALYWPTLLVLKTTEEGAQAVLRCCGEPKLVHGGYYMDGGDYGATSGVNCLSDEARDVQMGAQYLHWANTMLKEFL